MHEMNIPAETLLSVTIIIACAYGVLALVFPRLWLPIIWVVAGVFRLLLVPARLLLFIARFTILATIKTLRFFSPKDNSQSHNHSRRKAHRSPLSREDLRQIHADLPPRPAIVRGGGTNLNLLNVNRRLPLETIYMNRKVQCALCGGWLSLHKPAQPELPRHARASSNKYRLCKNSYRQLSAIEIAYVRAKADGNKGRIITRDQNSVYGTFGPGGGDDLPRHDHY